MNRILVALTGLLAVGLSACGGGGDPLANDSGGEQSPPDVVAVSSANFTENRLLAEIYAQALESKGVGVTRNFGIGSREVLIPALQDGSVDLIPEYTGNLLQELNPETTATAADAVYQELGQHMPEGLVLLDQSAAENKDAVVVTRETVQQYDVRSIADLAPHCGDLVFGGPPEFAERPYGTPGIEKLYGCTFAEFRSLDAGGPLTVAALADGSIQAADLFTTDPTIADRGWVALEDPKNNFAAQNVAPLINEAKASPPVRDTLDAISAALTTADLVELNRELAADPANNTIEAVASRWLTDHQLV